MTKNKNKVIWFTGLSGSGKTTLAVQLEKSLREKGILSFVLDGDKIRQRLNKDLGFSPEDRKENIRRITEVSKLFYDAGVTTIVSFISPYKEERDKAREIIKEDFIEIFLNCSLEECIKRDPKRLYTKALKGEIKEFTGIDAPYEVPENPELTLKTDTMNIEECVKKIVEIILKK